MSNVKCEFCGIVAKKNDTSSNVRVTCPNCGDYLYTWGESFDDIEKNSKIATFLFYNKKEKIIYHICKTDEEKKDPENAVRYVSYQEIESWYPKKFNEKIDKFLLMLAEKSEFIGFEIKLYNETDRNILCYPAFFTTKFKEKSYQQIEMLYMYMKSQDLICGRDYMISLTGRGWQKVDELQSNNSYSKDVFVAMAFNDDTKSTREAIRKGILNSGYSAAFIDEIIHNHQIVPEMFRLIRDSRFLILEISDPNYGAYYEAGYALGLGKEVIVCCRNDMFNKDFEKGEKKYAKYLKPHFDIAQKQILVWNDEEDLIKKLSEWIKAIVG